MVENINLIKLHNYIRYDLVKKLQKDLQSLKIIKESDIECCAYYHIRSFIGERSKWKIFARKYVQFTGHYIDFLIFDDKETPVIAIELKWAKYQITDKDRKSLEKAISDLGVQKAYWISVINANEAYTPSRLENDKYNLFQIIVPLGLDKDSRAAWISNRMIYRIKMNFGRRLK